MNSDILGLLIALVAVCGGLGLPFFVIYHQNKERRALIEKGMDPNLVFPWRKGQTDRKRSPAVPGPLLWGSLLAGIGLGILTGYFISYYTGFNDRVMMNGTAILFGGFALLACYRYGQKQARNKAE